MTEKLDRYLLQADRVAFTANFAKYYREAYVTLQMYNLFVNGDSIKQIPDYLAQRDKSQKTLLHYAVAGAVDPLRCPYAKLLRKQDTSGLTALMIASVHHNIEWVYYLVEHEAGISDHCGCSALFYACRNAVTPESYRIIDFLLDYEWFIIANDGKCFLDLLDYENAFYQYCEDRVKANIAYFERLPEGMIVRTEYVQVNGNIAEIEHVCSIWRLMREAVMEVEEWTAKISQAETATNEQFRAAEQSAKEMNLAVDVRYYRVAYLRAQLVDADYIESQHRKLAAELRLLDGTTDDVASTSMSSPNMQRRKELYEKLYQSFQRLNM